MVEAHEINATAEERKASELSRNGNRYYPIDESYDKRVYENDWFNYVKIVVVLIIFYVFTAIHFWAVFSLGIVNTEVLGWYSIGTFFFTIIFIACQIVAGTHANKLKRQHQFYIEIIAERRAEEKDRETKQQQEEEHAKKLEKIAAAKAMKAEGAANVITHGHHEVVTNIQDDHAPVDDDVKSKLIKSDARE